MNIDELDSFYKTLAKEVFEENSDSYLQTAWLWYQYFTKGEKYDSSKLENILKTIIKNKLGSTDVILKNTSFEDVKVLIVAADDNSMKPEKYLFYNYDIDTKFHCGPGMSDIEIWKALMATTAAATYFKPYEIKPGLFMQDGGFYANNPSIVALDELETYFNLGFGDLTYFVSLGTGSMRYKTSDNTFVSIAKKMTNLITDAENTHSKVSMKYHKSASYFRFNPTIPELDLTNTDIKVLNTLQLQLEQSLLTTTQKYEFQKLLELINENQNDFNTHDEL